MLLTNILLGAVSSLLASGIEGFFIESDDEKFTSEVNKLCIKIEEDMCIKFPDIIKNENFFNRDENVRILTLWLRKGVNVKEIHLDGRNFDSSLATEEQIEYLTKLLMDYISDYNEIRNRQMYNMIQNLHNKMLDDESFYKNNLINKKIILVCNCIDRIFRKNLNISLWCKECSLNEEFLVGNNYEDAMQKLFKLITLWNSKEFDEKSQIVSDDPFGSLTNMIKYIGSDYSEKVSLLYERYIHYIWIVMNENVIKSSDFYVSIGALGLASDYSNENIYRCVLEKIYAFLSLTLNTVHEIFLKRNYALKEKEVIIAKNRNVYNRIKIDDEDVDLIKSIFDKGEIIDINLAKDKELEISGLRRRLYQYTSSFLGFKYHDNFSTKIYIKHHYIESFQLYYNDIFGGNENETTIC